MSHSRRVRELEGEIQKHNKAYFEDAKPLISDFEYDQLVKELRSLEPQSKVLAELGNPVFGQKVQHSQIMGTLSKIHSKEDLLEKFGNSDFPLLATPKIDGASMAVRYLKGKLDIAISRGNGAQGENVTLNALQIANLPSKVPQLAPFEVRGEVYVARKTFEAINKEANGKFANPRNYASGSLRQKDPLKTRERKLSFVAYQILKNNDVPVVSKADELAILKLMGFEVPESFLILKPEKIDAAIQVLQDKSKFPYDTDGAVVQINDMKKWWTLGYKESAPKGSTAWKFESERATSVIERVEWRPTRTGRIFPVGFITQVQLSGTRVRKVTLNSVNFMEEMGIDEGAKVVVTKANEIIPQVVEVLETRKPRIPKKCPSCNEPTVLDGAHLYCNNEFCDEKQLEAVKHFFRALELKGFGGASWENLVEYISESIEGKITVSVLIQKIYELDVDMLQQAGFGPKQREKLFEALNSIEVSQVRFLAGLGLPGMGKRLYKNVLKIIQFENLVKGKFTESELKKVEGLGSSRITQINSLFKETSIPSELRKLVKISDLNGHSKSTNSALKGKKFCITGTLSKKRKEYHDIIEQAGGELGSVGSSLDFLVVGIDPGSKLDKAKRLGISIINEEQLTSMLEK